MIFHDPIYRIFHYASRYAWSNIEIIKNYIFYTFFISNADYLYI
jgi:hypothetical protein